jgi:WD40 repeat protein/serine/threonine protein kinase
VRALVPASDMSQQDENDPSLGKDEPETRPVSFIQRLHRHFGKEIDPEINLQAPGEGESSATPRSKGKAADLHHKLAEQMGLGPRYKVGGEIARGGMGTILRVWDEDLRRNLAMKVMHLREAIAQGSSTFDEERLSRFLEEAQITGQLDHPGIVPVHDLGIDHKGRCYFTMRLVRGRELKEILDLARAGKEGWTRTRALGLVLKVCEAMAFAHSKGVVHRDLKPSNVMVGRFGEVYVMDWGLARVLGRRDSHDLRLRPAQEASSLSLVRTVRKDDTEANPDSPLVTMDGDVVGTPSFMAPEQAQGKLNELGPRSDVYALGAILYYMLTGKAPYVEPGERVSPHTVLNRVLSGPPMDVRKLAREEPAELIAICEKAMSRDASLRYAGMLEVADDLQAFLENRVVRAYEGGSIAEFKKWVARNRGMAAGIAGMVLLSFAGALVFAWQQKSRVVELSREQQATKAASETAVKNAEAAQKSAAEAQKNLELANRRAEESRVNEKRAAENERDARRREYMANLLAAHFSLELNDMKEARRRLSDCSPIGRKWEWDHLRCAAYPHLVSYDGANLGSVDDLAWVPDGAGGGYVALLRHGGKLEVREPERGFLDSHFQGNYEPPVLARADLSSIARARMSVCLDKTRIALIAESKVLVLETTNWAEYCIVDREARRPTALAFGPTSQRLAVARNDNTIQLYEEGGERTGASAEGAPAKEPYVLQRGLVGHTAEVTELAYDPSGRRLASASRDGTVRIWDHDIGGQLHLFKGHRGPVLALAWDDAGTLVFTGGVDQLIHQWSAENGRLLATFTGHAGAIQALQYDAPTGRLVSGSADRTVRIWDVRDGGFTLLRGSEAPVLDAALSPKGATVLVGSADGTAQVYDVRGDPSITDLAAHGQRIAAAIFSPDGTTIASGDERGEVFLWDALSGEPLRRLRAREADGEAGEGTGGETGAGEHRSLRAHEKQISALAFDPAGEFVFSASADGRVRRWSVDTGQERSLYLHPGAVTAMILVADGARLLTGCADGVLRTFDVETGEVLEQRENTRAQRLVADPDGRHIAAMSGRDVVRLDLEGVEEPRVLSSSSNILCCAFGPDDTFVTGAQRGEVALLDLDTDTGTVKKIASDGEHKEAVRAVVFHPEHPRFASGSADGTVRIRDAATNLTLLTLEWPGARVTSLAFSADGSRLLAGSQEGGLRIFETRGVMERHERSAAYHALLADVEPRVEELFDEHLFLDEVLRRLQSAEDLSAEQRSLALRRANFRGDDPQRWVERGLADACVAGGDPGSYTRAIDLAERARSLGGDELEARVRLVQGIARYRLDDLPGCVDALAQAEAGGLEADTAAPVLRQLFLAMAKHRSGDREGARATFDGAGADHLLADPTVYAVRGEAEDLLRGGGTSQ